MGAVTTRPSPRLAPTESDPQLFAEKWFELPP